MSDNFHGYDAEYTRSLLILTARDVNPTSCGNVTSRMQCKLSANVTIGRSSWRHSSEGRRSVSSLTPAHLWITVVSGRCTQRQKNDNADRSKCDADGESGVASDTHTLAHLNACRSPSIHPVTWCAVITQLLPHD